MNQSLFMDPKDAEKFLERFAERMKRKLGSEGGNQDFPKNPLDWAMRYRELEGKKFSLSRFKPLEQIYFDMALHKVIIKPAQRGVSEYAINLTCFILDVGPRVLAPQKIGLNVAYLFPTEVALRDFSKERFGELAEESDYMRDLFGSKKFDGITFKQVGRSFLYLRGGWSVNQLTSFAADALILDEFDRMNLDTIALARRRLNASDVRLELDLSTPRLPASGIDEAYSASDQNIWENWCPECDAWFQLDFHRDVRSNGEDFGEWQAWSREQLNDAKYHVACPGCKQPINPVGTGRWTALRPDVTDVRGYRVPPLAFPFVNYKEFAKSAVSTNPEERREFFNSDLGLPFTESGTKVTSEMLARLSIDLPGGRLPECAWYETTMGVDVGSKFNFRISSIGPGNRIYVREMGTVDTWADLDTLMERFRIRHCVIDAMPELHRCEEFARKWHGRVLRAFYNSTGDMAGKKWVVPTEAGSNPFAKKTGMTRGLPPRRRGTISVNRTMSMDAVYSSIVTCRELWPTDIVNLPMVQAQMTAPTRVEKIDKYGQPVADWAHTRPDHAYHSVNYDQLARETLPAVLAGGGATGVAHNGWFGTTQSP